MTVTFIGHRDTPFYMYWKLKKVLIYLIRERGAEVFYVGNHGSFDSMVKKALKKLKKKFSRIEYTVVRAYYNGELEEDEILPVELMSIPERERIIGRNCWMISQADAVVTFVRKDGCSKRFREIARNRGLEIIDI